MDIYGHCRFSWFGISDTGREIKDVEDAKARLWHPWRMAIRFHLFERLLLPSLAAQTDPDFTLFVIVSDDMPEAYQHRLDRAAGTHAFVRLLRTPSRDYGRLIAPVMRETTGDGSHPSAHFRIDDDDALPATYIARLRKDAGRADPGDVICYSHGIVGFLHGGRACHGFRSISFHAQGLARVAGPGFLHSPLHMQHRSVGSHARSYTDPTFIGFHFTQHGVNNTKGYGAVVHEGGADARFMELMTRGNPALGQGLDASAECDAALAASFPFSTGPALRADLRRTTDPAAMAEEMGFAQG